jgi:hypothetical protein
MKGYLPYVWEFIKSISIKVASALGYDVPVPIWLFLIITILIITLIFYSIKLKKSLNQKLNRFESEIKLFESEIKLNELELEIMKILSIADGKDLQKELIKSAYESYNGRIPNLRLESALDSLETHGLLEYISGAYGATSSHSLTAKGRDYAIEKEFVK